VWYERLGDPENLALALNRLGDVCAAREQFAQGEMYLHKALTTYVSEFALTLENDIEVSSVIAPGAWHRLGDIGDLVSSEGDPGEDFEGTIEDEDVWMPALGGVLVYGIEINRHEKVVENGEEIIPLLLVQVTDVLPGIWYSLGSLYQTIDDFDQAEMHLRLSGEMYLDLGDESGVQRTAQALRSLGASQGELELSDFGVDYLRKLVEVARSRGDRLLELETLLSLAAVQENDVAERSQAAMNYAAAQRLAHTIQDRISEAAALDGLARLDLIAQDFQGAQDRFGQVLQIYQQIGYGQGELRILQSMADLALARYDPDTAFEYFRSAVEMSANLSIPTSQVDALRGMGRLALYRDQYSEAVDYYQQAANIAHRVRIPYAEILTLNDLAYAHLQRADIEAARAAYQRALEIAQKSRRPAEEASALLGLGDVALRQRSFEDASEAYERARTIYLELRQLPGELNALLGIVEMHFKRRDSKAHVQAAEEAVAIARRLEDKGQELRAETELGSAYSYAGMHEQAIKVQEEVVRRDPRNPAAVGMLGNIQLQAGNYEQSLAESRRAWDMDDSQIWVLLNIGHALLGLGRADDAEDTYRKAIAAQPEGGDFEEDIKDIEMILRRRHDTPRAKDFLALFQSAQAELDAAKKPAT
jgi:tetratricopeptide (TPR) repeat protein